MESIVRFWRCSADKTGGWLQWCICAKWRVEVRKAVIGSTQSKTSGSTQSSDYYETKTKVAWKTYW